MNKSESEAEFYIWYGAYGSNLLKERFMCYLQGTEFRTDNGTILRAPPKCDAGTTIQGDHQFNDQPFRLPFKLYFARDPVIVVAGACGVAVGTPIALLATNVSCQGGVL